MKFNKVRFRNFLSFGNKFTELDLSNNLNILVTGENGAGKTTALEAFYFGMTGKPFRKIKKEELINTINKKDLLVEVEFEHDGSNFLVKRGIKPNIFEFYKDGLLVDTDSSRKDYQKTLEMLIGVDSDTFANTIFVSSKNYTPFLKLNASEKRNFIENVLNIKIFTEMLEELKVQRGIVKEKVNTTEFTLKNNQDKLAIAVESNKRYNIDKQTKIDNLTEELNNLDTTKNNYEDKIIELETEYKKLDIDNTLKEKNNILQNLLLEEKQKIDTVKNEYNKSELQITTIKNAQQNSILEKESKIKEETLKAKSEHEKIKNDIKYNTVKIKELKEKIDFYANNTICPTCNQPISMCNDSIKCMLEKYSNEINTLEEEIKQYNNEVETLKVNFISFKESIDSYYTNVINQYNNEIEECNKKKDEKQNQLTIIQKSYEDNIANVKIDINEIENTKTKFILDINSLKHELSTTEILINRNKKSIDELKNDNRSIIDTKQFEDEIVKNNENLVKVKYDLESILEMINILSDKGIKSYIVKKYIPILNELVNKYLEIFSAKYRIAFNEEFDIEIFAKGYEKLSYGSFSSGEEQRLDLSLLFAFYELGKLKKSINTNVIFFDEISDKSLDSEGIDGLLNIFNSMKRNGKTVYNISHRIEMQDKFDKTLKVYKVKGFSNIGEI